MEQKMLNKKRNLRPGEIVPIYYDECFKIMYGSSDNIDILTMLISKILKVEYDKIEGKVAVLPLTIQNKTIGEKKTERDIIVRIKDDHDEFRIILEVNINPKFYQTVIERNIHYMNEVASDGFNERTDYSLLPVTILVNFNNFYVDYESKLVIEEYLYKNQNNRILTEKRKILNINIAKCYDLWYHNKYEGIYELYQEELLLIGAALHTNKQQEFEEIVSQIEMKEVLKEKMKGVVDVMMSNDDMIGRFYNAEEEKQRIQAGIINEITRKVKKEGIDEGLKKGIETGRKEGLEEGIKTKQKEMIMNMYNDNLPIDIISKYASLSIKKVKEIINNN